MVKVFTCALYTTVCIGGLLAWPVHAQQPPAPPDCPAQLGQALARTGTAQALAKEDREGVILYFQAELRKLMQERDELKKQVDEGKKAKEPGT